MTAGKGLGFLSFPCFPPLCTCARTKLSPSTPFGIDHALPPPLFQPALHLPDLSPPAPSSNGRNEPALVAG